MTGVAGNGRYRQVSPVLFGVAAGSWYPSSGPS